MRTKLTLKVATALLSLSTLHPQLSTSFAQGTAFTYQGRLTDNGVPAEGRYDVRALLFTAPTSGTLLGTTNTVLNVPVTNGLFTVPFDFGDAAFVGGGVRWLELAVRTNGASGDFSPLHARQPLTPTPMALWAGLAGTAYAAAPGTITSAALSNGVVTSAKISGAGAASGEVLCFDGTDVRWHAATLQLRSLAELRALSAGALPNVIVLGYDTPGDGGGGLFIWDGALTKAHDGGTVITPLANPPTGRWCRPHDGTVSVRWFGARGDGTNNDHALNATLV